MSLLISRRSGWRAVAALSTFVLILTACGGDDDEADATTDSVQESPAGTDGETDGDTGGDDGGDAGAEDGGGDAWQAILEAAREEGTVTFYSGFSEAAHEAVAAAFEEAYPEIDAGGARGATAEMISRIDQEREQDLGSRADVAFLAGKGWYDARSADEQLQDLTPLPNASHWTGLDDVFHGDHLAGALSATVIAWNTDIVDADIQGYEDIPPLLDDLQGLVGMHSMNIFLASFYDQYIEPRYGEEYIRALGDTGLRLYAGGGPLGQAVGAGEVGLVHSVLSVAGITPVQDEGAPVDFVIPDPAPSVPIYMAALGWAEHPNAALVFLDWTLSPDGQAALTDALGGYLSGLGGEVVPNEAGVEETVVIDTTVYTDEELEELQARYSELLGM